MKEEVVIDEQWLFERGHLHDAQITKIEKLNDDLFIHVDDEWSNFDESETGRPHGPGVLVAHGVRDAPKIDEKVFHEMISEVILASRNSNCILKIICFGQHFVEVACDHVLWWRFVEK